MPFYGLGLITLLVQFACAAHVVRSGRSYLWIPPIMVLPWLGCAAYAIYALASGVSQNYAMRRFADDTPNITDPGTSYRQKKRDVETVGSAQAKRVFAEECIKRGRFQDAVDLYQGAAVGTFAADPALLHGLGRAKLLAGDPAGSQAAYEALKVADPAAFTHDARLDYARALAAQGKNDDAVREYEALVPVYPGEEARARYGVLLKNIGQAEKARALFERIVADMKASPRYVRRRQREWLNVARRNLAA
jgi:hypothetical protein